MIQTLEKNRTTEEVFNSHREAIETLNIEKLMADYAEDALFVTQNGSFTGREAILTGFFQAILAQFPDMKISFDEVTVEGDICMIQFSAEASAATIPVGIGTLFIRDGLIQRQAEWFQLEPKEG
jgi:ketosteroid isomerase-like protein